MTKKEMIEKVAEVTGFSKKDAEAAVVAYEDTLIATIKEGGAYRINGLGTVTKVLRAARRGRNPKTGEEIQIPAGYGVKLTAGSALKKAVAKK